MDLEKLLNEEKVIEVTGEEAMLFDWILTLHSFDETTLGWLMKEDIQAWREQAGEAIVRKKGSLRFSYDDLKLVVVLIPITFRFGENDVGYSLKLKLYKAYLNLEDIEEDDVDGESKDRAESEAESGTLATTTPLSTEQNMSGSK